MGVRVRGRERKGFRLQTQMCAHVHKHIYNIHLYMYILSGRYPTATSYELHVPTLTELPSGG